MAIQYLTSGFLTNVSSPHNLATLPHDMPQGMNNEFIRNISFSIVMSSFNTAILTLSDAK